MPLVFGVMTASVLDFRQVFTIVSALPAIPRATRLTTGGPWIEALSVELQSYELS